MDPRRSSDAEIMNKRNFSGVLEGDKKTACEALRLVVDNFLGRHRVG
jgi:hypothetical protein